MTRHKKKILIVRNDKLGDFILSLPAFSLLKQYLPEFEIHALVPTYTKDIAKLAEYIDHVIIDTKPQSSLIQHIHTLKKIKAQDYSAIITLFTTTRIGIFAFLSGIKYRLAPATKLAQIFYNHRITQRRSRSLKPEYEYNVDLAVKYLTDSGILVDKLPSSPYLHFKPNEIKKFREDFFSIHNLKDDREIVIVHPGSGGSATNLDINQYSILIKNLHLNKNSIIVITAGPTELDIANRLSFLIKETPHLIYHSTMGLVEFTKTIQLCELFISSSTGPLHIAGALNRPTAAFYQRRRSATALRWQTLNTEDRRLAFMPPADAHESDMQQIDVIAAAKIINEKYFNN